MYLQMKIPVGSGTASMTCMLLPASPELVMQQEKPMVVICPGGGYEFVSDREAEPIAAHFLAAGFHTAIVRYSVTTYRYPSAARELAWCL